MNIRSVLSQAAAGRGYTCGSCPQGFEGNADKAYNPGGRRATGCRLPKLDSNSTNKATVQMAPQKVKFMAPANVMDDPNVQEKYIAELVKELAAEMGIDPSKINVQGLEETEPPDDSSSKRRLLSDGVTHVHLHFTLASDSAEEATAALQSLGKKLANPNSTLGAAAGQAAAEVSGGTCTACGAHPGQTMEVIKYVCPVGMVHKNGVCEFCRLDEGPRQPINPDDLPTACEKCPLGEDNPRRFSTCQCEVRAIPPKWPSAAVLVSMDASVH